MDARCDKKTEIFEKRHDLWDFNFQRKLKKLTFAPCFDRIVLVKLDIFRIKLFISLKDRKKANKLVSYDEKIKPIFREEKRKT